MAAQGRFPRGVLPLAIVTAAVLLAGATTAYVMQPAQPVTADDALRAFREATGGSPSPSPSPAGPATGVPAPVASPGVTPSRTPGAPAVGTLAPATPRPGTSRPAPSATATRPGEAAPVKPPPGVYTWRTSGYEETDALSGSRHDYPAETYSTARDTGCGAQLHRWQPLEERWEEADYCIVGATLEIRRITTYNEFFGRSQEMTYRCPAGSVVYSFEDVVGETWEWTCRGDGGTSAMRARVAGVTTLVVGGERVKATHITYDLTFAGDTRGTRRQERWIDQSTGLVVRLTSRTDVETRTPFGFANYVEDYRIDLVSRTPRR